MLVPLRLKLFPSHPTLQGKAQTFMAVQLQGIIIASLLLLHGAAHELRDQADRIRTSALQNEHLDACRHNLR
jgi:hypothetical protein